MPGKSADQSQCESDTRPRGSCFYVKNRRVAWERSKPTECASGVVRAGTAKPIEVANGQRTNACQCLQAEWSENAHCLSPDGL
jgi:hypothetical protein